MVYYSKTAVTENLAGLPLSIARMFIFVGLANKIDDIIVDKQGYDVPHALSQLDKKGIEMLVTAIYKSRGMKSGTWNPGINDPL